MRPAVASTRPTKSPNKFLLAMLVFICAFATYANTFPNSYVLDDMMMVPENRLVQQGIKAIPELLSTPYLHGYLSFPNDNYRPLSPITLAIETQFCGVSPYANHVGNVLIYALCCIALFFFLRRLLGAEGLPVALCATLLFTFHPIHTEAVANIKSRDELLCFLLAISSLYFFLRFVDSGKYPWLVGGAVALFASLLAKETSITLLAVFPLLAFFTPNGTRSRTGAMVAGSVSAAILFLGLRFVVLKTNRADQSGLLFFIDNELVKAGDLSHRLGTAMSVLGSYILLILVPYPLICNYGINNVAVVPIGAPSAIMSALLYVAIVGFAVYRFIKFGRDIWAFGLMFWVAPLSIVSNLFFLIAAVKAERFLFFPSVGFAIIVGAGIVKLADAVMKHARRKANLLTCAVVVPICLLYFNAARARNEEWRDNYTLFSADVAKAPENARLNFYMGNEMSTNFANAFPDPATHTKIISESIPYLRKSLELYPDYDLAHTSLGTAYFNLGKYDSAEMQHKAALAKDTGNVLALNGLAGIYFMKHDYPSARDILIRDIKINASSPDVVFNLGNCYLNMRKFDSSVMFYRMALHLNPQHGPSLKGMAMGYFYMGATDSANKYIGIVRQTEPGFRLQ